jgi:hypothetical protein
VAEFHTYDSAADQNQQAVPNGLPRGTPGGFVYGVIREMAAACRRFHEDRSGRLKATGSNGNYVVATSRSIDLTRGASIRFRANHQNPNAGPTLLGRPLTYADGSTIPAGGIKVDQLCDASWDNDNSRWALTVIPAGAATQGGNVTGDKISLSGEAQGSVAIRSGPAWIASAAGTATQFFRGGPNPGFAAVPGTAKMLCTVLSGPTITSVAGLTHTASVTRLSEGRYRITPSPIFPNTDYRVLLQSGASSSGVRISTLDPADKLASSFVFLNTTYNANSIDTVYTDIAVFY